MPSKSKAQQRFMGMVHAAQKGEKPASTKVAKVAARMKKSDAEDYASTKHKGKPEKVKQETKVRALIRKMVREIMSEVGMGPTTKKGKSVRVKHKKSGKELVITDKPAVIKRYKRLGYEVDEGFAGGLKKEERKKFDKHRRKQSEVLGYTLTGTDDLKTDIGDATIKEDTKRDYKTEYKKFQSSKKSKKYRAELNQYNRKKGTYGNGDGKDASHKGGKIAGFEKESVNRGRAEKSRLKKEEKLKEDSLGDKFHKTVEKHRQRIEKEKEAYRKARELQKKRNEGKLNEAKETIFDVALKNFCISALSKNTTFPNFDFNVKPLNSILT